MCNMTAYRRLYHRLCDAAVNCNQVKLVISTSVHTARARKTSLRCIKVDTTEHCLTPEIVCHTFVERKASHHIDQTMNFPPQNRRKRQILLPIHNMENQTIGYASTTHSRQRYASDFMRHTTITKNITYLLMLNGINTDSQMISFIWFHSFVFLISSKL